MNTLISFPTSVMSELLDMIKQAFETYTNNEDHTRSKYSDGSTFEVLHRVQRASIILQNFLFIDKRKIFENFKKLTGQMITTRF